MAPVEFHVDAAVDRTEDAHGRPPFVAHVRIS
jgi:hypothetical protein